MGATEIIEDLTGVELIEVVIEGPAGPAGADGTGLDGDIADAVNNANAPDALNPFATVNDLPDISGKLDHTSGTATGIKETEPADIDGTGGTATLNLAVGNVQVLGLNATACTLSPSNWPTTESASMTLLVTVATGAHGGANWTAFTPAGNAAPDLTGITHTTGYGIYEILWAAGKFWWFTVEEV